MVTFTLESYFLLIFVFIIIPYSLVTFFFLVDLSFKIYLFIWSYHDLLVDLSEVYAIIVFVFILINSITAPSLLIQHTTLTQNLTKQNYLSIGSLFITYALGNRFLVSLTKLK